MAEFNRHTFPNGGWQFRQPQFNWTNPFAMVGFDVSVKEIIKVRKQNPALTAKFKLSTDYNTVADELENFTRMRLGLPAQEPSFFESRRNRLPEKLAVVAADIKRASQGTGVVLDWLMSGGTAVAPELAVKRAAICVACPKNVDGSWYTVAPAELIKETLAARSDLKLETPYDAQLKSCDVCKCLMRLKVWCPMVHIVSKTKPDVMAEFPAHCWIKRNDQ